jgi:UDP-N-acetylmuramate--alanine ligase
MDCYRDMADIEDAFVDFMDRVPFYGAVIACCDNPHLNALLPRVRRRVFTYGTSSHADYIVRALPGDRERERGDMPVRSSFEIVADKTVLGPFDLLVPGHHNVLNATAAIAIAHQLEIAPEAMVHGLRAFRGVDRRFQTRGCVRGVTVVDDYGHHPTEIVATIRAAEECGFRRIHVIFQPHRYTRTRDLLPEFARAFDGAETVEVLDIYPASEQPIAGVDAPALIAAANHPGMHHAASFPDAAERAAARAEDGDVVLTLGAGNVSQAAPLVLEALGAMAILA